jgi:4-diphosphocytidyl-2-C-methyl-D-erythritol kinase
MSGWEWLSPAKLNLFLHVVGQRRDGYHELQTLFQLVNWGDKIRFEASEQPGIRLTGNIAVPHSQNLIVRAAEMLRHDNLGVDIHIEKVIPMGGGLGGGSSNAATTLLALNQLWSLGFSLDELAQKGSLLGADVPVFVRQQTAWAEGVGELLTPVTLAEDWFLIVKPDCAVSTAEIFSAPELTRDSHTITLSAFFDGQHRNDLQNVVERRYPEVRNALIWLGNHSEARLTGSGACVFARFESRAAAQAVANAAPPRVQTWVVQGMNQTPSAQAIASE